MAENQSGAKADVVLIGAGIMSATLGTMLKELEPSLNIVMLERLDDAGQESSAAWNNAGTGHAANCELNYTPQNPDGSVDISRALEVNAEFDLSRQLWSYLIKKKAIAEPRAFINPCPHMSFVWGEANLKFLRARYKAMSAHHSYHGMEYSEDREQIADWAPLIIEGRDPDQPIAATRIVTGADVDYGSLTHLLVANLAAQTGFSVTDSLRRQGKIEWIHVRHEEAAAFAAAGEAHLTDTLAVCAGSCGPGNLHLINGLFDAHRSRVPVLAIAAQIPSAEIGSGYFQETYPQDTFRECSHFCELISSANQMPRTLEMAIHAAVAKRGVAVVVIPGDVALLPALEAPLPKAPGLLPAEPAVAPATADLDRLAALLNRDARVTMLCGSGCQGAHKHILSLAERLKAPIVHALKGKEHVEWDNPYDVGMTGLIGFSSGYYAMLDCDILLMLGTDFPYRQFYPRGEPVRIAQVDQRGEVIGRRTPVDIGVVGDVRATIDSLLPRLKEKRDTRHLDQAREHYRTTRKGLDELAVGRSGKPPIHPQQIAKAISDLASEDAIFTCDVGLPTVWAARYLAMNGKRRLVGSFWHGSMATMPQAIGVQATFPKRQVISLSGDGGFSMLMGDFLTLVQHDLPVKVVVFNNGALGFIEIEQKSSGFLDFGTKFKNPNFAAMAEAVGARGVRLEDPGDVESGIAEALAHDGPVLVDAVISKMVLPIPPGITVEMAKGFTLYMMKAVLSGRGDDLIDLAKANLWQ